MHEHIPGLRTRARGETLSQNRTECLHAPQATRQRGMFTPAQSFFLGLFFLCFYGTLIQHMLFKQRMFNIETISYHLIFF